MSDKKKETRTPGFKHRAPDASPLTRMMGAEIYSPSKRSRTDLTVKNIADEEFPEGYTFFDTTQTPSKSVVWKNTLEKHSEEDPNLLPLTLSEDKNEHSILGQFDELMETIEQFLQDDLTDEFLEFATNQEKCRLEWLKAVRECKRLQTELDSSNTVINSYVHNLALARKLLDQEKKLRLRAERERDCLEEQMLMARDLLFSDKCRNRLPEDTREKLAFLNNTSVKSQTTLDRNTAGAAASRLNTISEVSSQEINSTGSLLSDFSCTRSEDDLDTSAVRYKTFKNHEPALPENISAPKKQRSTNKVIEINQNDKIVATTTLSVSKDGPVTATSIIETVPQETESKVDGRKPADKLASTPAASTLVEQMWLKDKSPLIPAGRSSIKRQHNFMPKAVIRPDICGPCNKRIRFGKIALRCKDCKGTCHAECKEKLPLPCVPQVNTPTQKGAIGFISDYTPKLSPMVPALIVHCLNEIELRGCDEIGIYRIPGSEKEVKSLKERFLRGKSIPILSEIDIHVICGVVKDFLRSLQEPLITQELWKEFIAAAEAKDPQDIVPSLSQAISQLPQPNKETLAYMILHLQKVAENKECKMPISNLSKIFGPTIVGYSSQDPDPQTMLQETRQQAVVMEQLLNMPSEYWMHFSNFDSRTTTPVSRRIQESPSTGFFTPYGIQSAQKRRKERKFFGTPPTK